MAISLIALKYFRTVATVGNISRAADVLNVAQSAISRQIFLLEEEFGSPLLLRHRRGVDVTPAGQLVLERADAILRQASDLRREVSALESKPHGALRVGFPASLGGMLIAPLISGVGTAHPSVGVLLFEGFSSEVAERIEDDRLDIGITSVLDPQPDLQLTPLFSEEIFLVGRPEGWKFGSEIFPQALKSEPLIMTNAVHRRVEAWLGPGIEHESSVIETDSQAMLIPLLRLGMGSLVIPRSSVHAELADGSLVGAPLNGLRLTRYLAERRDRVRSFAVSYLVRLLYDRLKELDDAEVLRMIPS
jgi:LysR family nitrogen assimilation transcriptional regulator